MARDLTKEFLRESNAIEKVYDEDSLTQALLAWEYIKTEKELSEDNILKTHKILMLNQKLRPDQKGYFRKEQVFIGVTRMIPVSDTKISRTFTKIADTMDWRLIKGAMKSWIAIANTPTSPEYAEEWIKQCHIQFEHIHPFVDGNGRMGRILLNWQRIRNNLPLLIIKESEADDYYTWFPKI